MRTPSKLILGLAQAVLAAAALHALVLALRGETRRPGPGPALDERAGRIREVLVQYAPASEFVRETYRQFFRELPGDVKVVVAVEKQADFDDFTKLTGRAATPVVTGLPITTWARDRFVACENGFFIVPPEPHPGSEARRNDWRVPFAVAASRGFTTRTAPFRFDGGDFTSAYGKIFCSSTWTARNPERSPAELVKMAEDFFGQPVVFLPVAPAHHVGMIFVPIGDNRFLVGDARWGKRLAPEGVDADLSEATAAKFDAVAEELKSAGFGVVRIPVLPTKSDFVWVTYTNAVLEPGRVWLPQYGFPALDAAAAAVWRDLGNDVRPIDVSAVYTKGGTLHCLVHVLRRDR